MSHQRQRVAVCRAEEVPDGRGVSRFIEETPVAIVREGETFHAFFGLCPHANGPLGRGWIEEGELLCPLHRWRYRLEDGLCSTFPDHTLRKFPCEVRDGIVWIEI